MLRLLVVILMMANLGLYAWTQGWLNNALGTVPDGDREPQRLSAQIDPTALRVLPTTRVSVDRTPPPVEAPASEPAQIAASAPDTAATPEPASAPAPAPAPANAQPTSPVPGTAAAVAAAAESTAPVCMEAGPFNAVEWRRAEVALRASLDAGLWVPSVRERPGKWMVYVGPYNSDAIMEKRAATLRKLGIDYNEVSNMPDYEPGFDFGRYTDEDAARNLKARLTDQGIKYVRVVPLVPGGTFTTVRIAKADATLLPRIEKLNKGSRFRAHPFELCPR